MASNQYVNWYTSANEQNLIENLVVEAIKFWAHDVQYLPRTGVNEDAIFNEYEFSNFEEHYPIEVYIQNVDAFDGSGEFLSKFGLEIRHQMKVQMSIRSFETLIKPSTAFVRPREGDLIYFPMLNAAYEIRFVNRQDIFYQLGKLYSYTLTLELFEYSNEGFDTGNTEIDAIYADFNFIANTAIIPMSQNDDVKSDADDVVDWTESSPFGDL